MTEESVVGATESRQPSRTRIVTFYSYKGGTGRTMAMANVAFVLANAGMKVLVVDWDLESPGLHRYFRPFLTDRDLTDSDGVIDMLVKFVTERVGDDARASDPFRHADFTNHVETLRWQHFPRGGRLDFLGPGRQEPRDNQADYQSLYEISVSTFPWSQLFDGPDETAFISRLRENMLSAGYDYVLIDSRTGVSDASGICTMLLPDVVVVGFAMNNQSIIGAAWVARLIQSQALRSVRVIPVPMRVEDGEQRRLDRRRIFAAYRFNDVLAELAPDSDQQVRRLAELEIPYKRFYAYEELLASFGDTPGVPTSLLHAYEALAATIHGRPLPAAATIPYAQRQRVARQFELADTPALRSAAVLALPADRAWGDWVVAQLRRFGIRMPTAGPICSFDELPAVEGLLLIASPALAVEAAEGGALRSRLVELIEESASADHRITVVQVARGATDWIDREAEVESVNISGLSAAAARERLLGHLGFVDVPAPEVDADGPRFPELRPTAWGRVPRRYKWFVGRDEILQRLRDDLTPGVTVTGPRILEGPRGAGKSMIAAEYAHRFSADYDAVWWINAADAVSIRRGLAALAARLRLDGAGEPSDEVATENLPELANLTLEALRRGEPHRRWLLVYDNAGRPDVVGALTPECTPFGHVLITSYHSEWADRSALPVQDFERAESIALLRLGLPAADDEDLARIADAVDDFPFDVNQAANSLDRNRGVAAPADAVSDYLTRLHDRGSRADGNAWAMEYNELRASDDPHFRASALLLEMCSFLAEDGIALSLLRSEAMAERLRGARSENTDTAGLDVDYVIQLVERLNLATMNPARDRLTVHGRSQLYVRERLSEQERARIRADVWRVLTAHASVGALDHATGRDMFAELRRHIRPSGATASFEAAVRRWMIYEVYRRWRVGELTDALDLADECLKNWQPLGPHDAITLQMCTWRATVLRSASRFVEAFDLDEQTLALQRQLFGFDDRRTLLTASGFGADKRKLGWYNDARAEDQTTYDIYCQAFGPSERSALDAGDNLALAQYLDGDVPAALRTARGVLKDRLDSLGTDNADTWWSQLLLGICLRDLGNPDEAWRQIGEARERLHDIEGPTSTRSLFASKQLAVTLRRRDDPRAARVLTNETLDHYQRRYPEDNLGRIACQLNLALDLHAVASHGDAAALAERSLAAHARVYGDDGHPIMGICRTDVAVCLLGNGQVDEALRLSQEAHDLLRQELYEYHPAVLAAAINHANCLLAAGQPQDAAKLDEETYRECLSSLTADHPYTRLSRFHHDGEAPDDLATLGLAAGPGVLSRRLSVDIDITVS
ncbi:FxSxx-COOH system tetratricopeptide repeat protein [Parafrankia discariae]|uniref:FxSxx-COOH system tetratricopeptide repeat protein n=1 Tax=Parafrankia discariae TaxID=365528 RepID=UPI0003A52725|nr:FxSxx-COOH system tetratricopeptide repeat protein [Parafrankia discariae]